MSTQNQNIRVLYVLNSYKEENPLYTYQNLKDTEATETIVESVPFQNKSIKVMWSGMEDIKHIAGYVYNYENYVGIVINAKYLSSELQHQTIIALLPYAVECVKLNLSDNEPHAAIKIKDLFKDKYKDIIANTLCPPAVCYDALEFYQLDKPKSDDEAFVMAQFLAEKLNMYPSIMEYQLKTISTYEQE